MVNLEIGQKVKVTPYLEESSKRRPNKHLMNLIVDGTIVMIHEPHRWFSVVYGDHKLRTSFSFNDIGYSVEILS